MKALFIFSFLLFLKLPVVGQHNKKMQDAYFASGCFWCVEAIFETIKGVDYAESGYAGGWKKNPSYEEVCSGKTGHAETVHVRYDASIVSYSDLLRVFFNSHDPSTKNQQGPDKGTQYRSVIFYKNEEEKSAAESYIKTLKAKDKDLVITTEIVAFTNFYKAESYHQDFEKNNPNNPYIKSVSHPRLQAFKKKTRDLLKNR